MCGEDGYWIYKSLIENIGEREKRCLPFVNMCLCVWMVMLVDDMDLFADTTLLNFDK